jgi:Ca2+-binding RTX toxin-like protein
MANFAASVDLTTLTDAQASHLLGAGTDDRTGRAVAHLGDINGDGIDDFAITSSRSAINGYHSGVVYIVYGVEGGLPADIELSAMTAQQGVILPGAANSGAGFDIAGQGDINGDGLTDLVVLASYSDRVQVAFGTPGGFPANLAPASLDGTTGFTFFKGGFSNESVTVGDFNGDGIDDFAVTNIIAGPQQSGAAYVVYGSDSGFPAYFDTTALDGTNGYVIEGMPPYTNLSGVAAGDLNGDGIDDLFLTGLSGSEVNYVVFGHAGPGAASLNVSTLDGTNGFRAVGATDIGHPVTTLDINGDGFDDAVFGAYNSGNNSGAIYVVFGHGGAFQATVDLTALDGSNGFILRGANADTYFSNNLARAGDINNDGVDDLLIGTIGDGAYVLLGRVTGFAADIGIDDLDGRSLIHFTGPEESRVGQGLGYAGDVNGDGIDDFVLGTPGSSENAYGAGGAYVIYGQQGDITRIGTAVVDVLDGASENDTLYGLAGKDVLNGLGGDDRLEGGADNDVVRGGAGADVLLGQDGRDILEGGDGDDQLDGGAESDKLFGGLGADDLVGGEGLDRMEGGDGVDTLTGGADNDYLDGGAGADALVGGGGNDVYVVDDLGDTTTELAGEGYDIVRTSLGWTLAGEIEALELQGSASVAGVGNGGANNLQGNGGDNILSGLGGVDTLNGGDGDDIIVGGSGNDLLRGGLGADIFRILQESLGGALETDLVYDFSAAEGDIVDLSGIDADPTLAGDQGFTVVGAFGKHAGEMTLSFASGITTLRLDVNGDGRVDYQMKLNGDVTGESAGWLL